MRWASIVLALAVVACSDPARHPVDARVDSPPDASGSAARVGVGGIEPSPADFNLELGVIAVSLVVAVGPVRSRKRRRPAL